MLKKNMLKKTCIRLIAVTNHVGTSNLNYPIITQPLLYIAYNAENQIKMTTFATLF